MNFGELYGEALSHELGSADTSELFTTVRRKSAINRAQREFARLTQCFVVELTVALTLDLAVYNMDAATSPIDQFVNFVAKPLRLKRTVTASGDVTETRLARHDEAWLDRHRSGWRTRPQSGTPDVWALRAESGDNTVIIDPPPDVPATETWDLIVPAQLTPPDMTGDADQPFSYLANPITSLEPYHWALAHYAAAQLERLRKDREAVESQLAMFGSYVQDFKATRRPRGGDLRVTQTRDYLQRSRMTGGVIQQGDPRV